MRHPEMKSRNSGTARDSRKVRILVILESPLLSGAAKPVREFVRQARKPHRPGLPDSELHSTIVILQQT